MACMGTADSRYFLRSARLGFREWSLEDRGLARALWGDPAVTALIDARGRLSDEDVERRLLEEIDLAEAYGVQYWPMFDVATGAPVGCCGLHPRNAEAGVHELGFHLLRGAWGKGYASEAARAVVRYSFEVLDSQELFAGHHPDNAASRRVLTKLGFSYTHDEPFAPTGLRHPSYVLRRSG